ncbi:MAG TPA: SDR family NAD(P)-dependent oxidoreductase [Ramlibacter sp.]|jgi:short-subunit dehydrogenase|uniref:SDR family NAD(P)-dependent oxidoreductase n=1 Tax=Ramlibacter sp. TaxID=1917967 RepID=UPI002D55E7B4|nr:SDR family NAD(P)-dependent oxidoreductase [Ramlibacter sp.]HZY17434.1 SDR family NAD(P)-dependent oxidoreductase [Ramlibacter sp.]
MRIGRLFPRLLLAWLALLMAGCAVVGPVRPDDVAGKTFVVTGASSGFGRGVAQQLGAMRANVVLAARRTDLLQEVGTQVAAAGGQALVVTTDVARPEEMARLAQAAVARFGRIDVWINNAAVGAIGRFEDIPVADHARVIDVNVKGVIHGSHVAMRQFRAQGQGSLVNIGSVESEVPLAYHASYSASKAAVLSLGRALNEEIRLSGQTGISVSTVMPWATDTPFFTHAANYSGGTPRMVLFDDPQKVVDAIVWVSLHPREELPVGWKASLATFSHWLAPDLTERISADIVQRQQFDTAPPAPPTAGSLHAPMREGRAIEGGVRERMQREDAARRDPAPPQR